MKNTTITFALFFGNRGFFPGELIADARKDLEKVIKEAGYNFISMDESKTKYGAVETIDLSLVFDLMDNADEKLLKEKISYCESITNFGTYPPKKLENIARFGVAMDKIIADYNLHAVGIRCWNEFQTKYGIAVCLVLADLNERGIPAACELDVNNAIMMYALQEASKQPVMLLDVNNNYNKDLTKTILFHCAAIPKSFYSSKTNISEHLMFKKSFGEGSGVGIVNGDICAGKVTIGSFKTEDGELHAFATEAELTNDKIEKEFFGCGTVAKSDNMPAVLKHMLENGYRHHVAIAKGEWAWAVNEAMEKYLGYKSVII